MKLSKGQLTGIVVAAVIILIGQVAMMSSSYVFPSSGRIGKKEVEVVKVGGFAGGLLSGAEARRDLHVGDEVYPDVQGGGTYYLKVPQLGAIMFAQGWDGVRNGKVTLKYLDGRPDVVFDNRAGTMPESVTAQRVDAASADVIVLRNHYQTARGYKFLIRSGTITRSD